MTSSKMGYNVHEQTTVSLGKYPGKEKLNFHFHTQSMTLCYHEKHVTEMTFNTLRQPQKQRKCQGELECCKCEGPWRLAVMETINKLVQHHR